MHRLFKTHATCFTIVICRIDFRVPTLLESAQQVPKLQTEFKTCPTQGCIQGKTGISQYIERRKIASRGLVQNCALTRLAVIIAYGVVGSKISMKWIGKTAPIAARAKD